MTSIITNKLEKIAAGTAGTAIAGMYLLCYNNFKGLHASAMNANKFKWLPIESYFGDTPEIFTAVLASGLLGDKIEQYGKTKNKPLIEKIGKHFPVITAAAVGAYYTLGESIMPYLLPGTADTKDIPAVIATAIASPIVVNYARKNWPAWKEKIRGYLKK